MAESVVWATIFVAGLALGSFLNVVIYRGPVMWRLVDAPTRGDLVGPRSYCPACRTPLRFRNLIPVVSYFMQSGRCAFCGARISVRYPFVEALGGALAVVSAAMFGCTPTAVLALIAALVFVALAFIDFETGYLPDALTLPLAALGLVANAFGIFAPLIEGLVGAAAGFLVFWVIGELYRLLRQRDGLGLGDAKLLAAIGAWTGWIYLPPVVLVAAAATLLFVLARGGANADDAAPFGPGLCAAGFVALFFGEQLFTAL